MEIMAAHHQWAKRPDDQRHLSLDELCAKQNFIREHSFRKTYANRELTVQPLGNDKWDIGIVGPKGNEARFTHWGFNQICQRADVPVNYLRTSQMPAALASDCLNWGLHHRRTAEEVSMLVRNFPEVPVIEGNSVAPSVDTEPGLWGAAFNGPNYGVVWNNEVANALRDNFGNGVDGDWKIPGEFGKDVPITKENTTIYSSDHDVWAFLVDEKRRIEVPDRRNGESGSLARGFYISNSENGASPIILGMFLFDYVCMNRIIWGASQFSELRLRHTKGAPYRFLEEIKPILTQYAESTPMGVQETIAAAKAKKLDKDVDDFLANRFGGIAGIGGKKHVAAKIQLAWSADEGERPMESLFDVVTGATAFARSIPMADLRFEVEREAGKILALAA